MTVEQQVLKKLRALPPQKQEEVLAFVSRLQEKTRHQPRRSLSGLWADLDVNVSEKDISQARREMCGETFLGIFLDGGSPGYARRDLLERFLMARERVRCGSISRSR